MNSIVKKLLQRQNASLVATILIALVLFGLASLRYDGFFSLGVFVNLIDDNAFLGIAAIGMTFVILSGGIDLSVGSMIGVTSVASALLVERAHWHPASSAVFILACAAIYGAFQGYLVARFNIAPFLVTLAGMFFLRGLGYTLSLESIALTHPLYRQIQAARIPLGSSSLPLTGLLFLAMLALGVFMAGWTRFGRGIYAIGGNTQSALLMGLPVVRTQIGIYCVSGFMAALAGLTYSVYTSSGNATAAMGLELDVIAAVVVGGTLLTGGRGSVIGTAVGVLILGTIQTIITFEGTLSSWWTRIVIGLLLFFFVVLQKLLSTWGERRLARKPTPPAKTRKVPNVSAQIAIGVGVAIVTLGVLASPLSAQADPPKPAYRCKPGYKSGAPLERGLYQLTGTHLKVGDHDSNDLPDPAPPYVNENGGVEIYGSARYFVRYDNWKEFERAGCYRVIQLDLRHPNMEGFPEPYTHPWDLRKYRIEESGKRSIEVILGGSMAPTEGRPRPRWPLDNINRRIYFFRKNANGRWVRDEKPVVGRAENQWIGHSYGGNLLQVGSPQNVIRVGGSNEVAFFMDQVTDGRDDKPYKTEIFAIPMSDWQTPQISEMIKLFDVEKSNYPSIKRTIGGFLVEGPRPIEMTIEGQKFFVVAFSSGDFPTDYYTLNYMWSRSLYGPYEPATVNDGSDLLDLGKELKEHFGLSWMGRPSIFQTPSGEFEMMFHAVRKDIRPDNDYTKWPKDLLGFYRCLFKATLDARLDEQGRPVLQLNSGRSILK
jgi:ribose/xylose/arabinose/galactoside ABC-type transport system permease subunit